MAIIHKTRVREVLGGGPNAASAFNLLGSAATGYRTFASCYSNNDQLPYMATNGTDWESGIGTFTTGSPNTIVRSTILESSNAGSAVNFSTGGAVTLVVEWPASMGQQASLEGILPGGRLSPSSSDPLATSAATTTIYYVPYVSNIVPLWNGHKWQPVEFSAATISLGTVTSGICYDVFGYFNAGALAIELVAWTSATARATPVVLQEGRYCKYNAGNATDKTKLLLGTFYTVSTTQTQHNSDLLGIGNVYNKKEFEVAYTPGVENLHSYSSPTWGNYNGSTNYRLKFVSSISGSIFATIASTSDTIYGQTAGSLNGSTSVLFAAYAAAANAVMSGAGMLVANAGYNYVQLVERSTTGTTSFAWGGINGVVAC